MKLTKELINAFLSGLPIKANKNDCWPWLGGSTGAGYGALYFNGKQYKAHTLSYQIFNDEISSGLIVRHVCDNPACVNPKHLIVGTHSDNTLDALKRDRLPNHSLNSEAVKVIKWMLKYKNYYGLSNKLAKLYKVNRKAIYKINVGITWKHIKV